MCIRDSVWIDELYLTDSDIVRSADYVPKRGLSKNKICIAVAPLEGRGMGDAAHLRSQVDRRVVAPVSYTHLDVYKRQVQDRPPRRGVRLDLRRGSEDSSLRSGQRFAQTQYPAASLFCLLYTSRCV